MAVPAEGKRCNRGRKLRPDVVRSDQELHLQIERSKGVTDAASTAFPRRPAFKRGFAFMGHGLRLPSNKRQERIGRDKRSSTYSHGPQAACQNVRIDRRSRKAGGKAGLLDAVGQFFLLFDHVETSSMHMA